MYLPKHFAETDVAEMHALMRAHPLATLVSDGPDGLNVHKCYGYIANQRLARCILTAVDAVAG